MGYLASILFALASLVFGEVFEWQPEPRPWAVLALLPLPHLAGFVERRAALAGRFDWAARLGRLGRATPVLGQLAAVALFGWVRSLELVFGVELSLFEWPHPALLLGLLPFVVLTLLEIDAEARASAAGGGPRPGLRSFQARMFLTGLGPICIYLLVASLLGCSELLRIGVEEVALWSLAFTGALLLAFIVALPRFLRATWDTQPLADGPQRELLDRVASLADFRCRELLVWNTGNLMANAAIVGLFPSGRRVFFTDALLRQLGPRQLAAVYGHEIGHAKRYHVLLFLLWALAFFALLDAGLGSVDPEDEALAMTLAVAGLSLWMIAFGWLSRRVELEADLFCLELLRDGIGITSALQSVAPSAHNRDSWRHFSTSRRIAFLNRAALDPAVGDRLKRRLRGAAVLGLVVFLATAGWRLTGFAGDYLGERTLVDLRLGRYAAAAARLGTGPEGASRVPEVTRRLVEFATAAGLTDFPARVQAAEEAASRASAALEGGRTESAAAWLGLAGLAGDSLAGEAAEWLFAHLDGAAPPAPEGLELGPWAPWLEALAAAP